MNVFLDRQVRSARRAGYDQALHVGLVAVAIAIAWVRPIVSSFWLDELGTYWVVQDGLRETLGRALRYQGQSPAYYVIAWVARIIGDGSEVVLRLPSLAAGALATLVMARLGRRLFGREAGWPVGVLFAVTPIVAFSAVDARPYAVGYLALATATLALTHVVDGGRRRWAVAYGAAAAAAVHSHYFLGLGLLGHLPFLLRRWSGMARAERRTMWLALSVAGLLVAPLALQVPYLLEHSRLPELPRGTASFDAFLGTLVPVSLVAGSVLGLAVARAAGPVTLRPTSARGALALGVGIWLGPSIALLVLSTASGINLLWQTYTRASAVGFALLLGGALASLEPAGARRVAVLVLVLIGLLASGGRWHSDQDWRGAAAEVNALVRDPSTPVLIHAAFIEAANVPLLDDPRYRTPLLAQLTRYPMEGSLVPIPYNLSPDARGYLETRVVPMVSATDRFLLVTLQGIAPFETWLEARLGPFGFESRQIGEHGSVQVTLFERSAT